jgi:septal ring factor EnvC (AmiA/AmiB activator)
MKMTVSEYAKSLNVSVQTVYKKIKRGVITTVKENNITYVVLEGEEGVTEVKSKVSESYNPMVKELLKIIKSKDKEIKRLTKALAKAQSEENQTLKEVFSELKSLKMLSAPPEENVIDLEEIKERKKRSKKKKKKK